MHDCMQLPEENCVLDKSHKQTLSRQCVRAQLNTGLPTSPTGEPPAASSFLQTYQEAVQSSH